MEFRRLLEECLERIRKGDSVQSCLDGNAEYAAELAPYLASAAVFRGLRLPAAGPGKAAARQRLMQSVAVGAGKEEAVFGVMKFAHVVGAFVGALFLMSVGLVAASGGGGFGAPFGGKDQSATTVEVKGKVVEVDTEHLVVMKGEDRTEFAIGDDTVFKDVAGHEIDGVAVDDFVAVLGKKSGDRLVALKVRVLPEESVAKPKETPTPAATPAPATPAPQVTPAPVQEAPPPAAPTGAVFEGYAKEVGSGQFMLKQGDGTKVTILFNGSTAFVGNLVSGVSVRVEALVYGDGTIVAAHIKVHEKEHQAEYGEFYGVITSIGGAHLNVESDHGPLVVYFVAQTQWSGDPAVGAKVMVKGTKNADGSVSASHITVKTAEFSGPIAWINGASMGVNAWDATLTVKWDGGTQWEGPAPQVGKQVSVYAYKMGDGSFLAKKIIVKTEAAGEYFQGTVISHNPGEFIIHVQVEAQVRVVCYEFADVIGTIAVGKLVKVGVDHVEGSTYFANLVKVLN